MVHSPMQGKERAWGQEGGDARDGVSRAEGPGVRGHLGSDGQLGMDVALRRARLAVDTCFRN